MQVMVSAEDREVLEAAAARERLPFSTWALRVLLAAAKKEAKS